MCTCAYLTIPVFTTSISRTASKSYTWYALHISQHKNPHTILKTLCTYIWIALILYTPWEIYFDISMQVYQKSPSFKTCSTFTQLYAIIKPRWQESVRIKYYVINRIMIISRCHLQEASTLWRFSFEKIFLKSQICFTLVLAIQLLIAISIEYINKLVILQAISETIYTVSTVMDTIILFYWNRVYIVDAKYKRYQLNENSCRALQVNLVICQNLKG